MEIQVLQSRLLLGQGSFLWTFVKAAMLKINLLFRSVATISLVCEKVASVLPANRPHIRLWRAIFQAYSPLTVDYGGIHVSWASSFVRTHSGMSLYLGYILDSAPLSMTLPNRLGSRNKIGWFGWLNPAHFEFFDFHSQTPNQTASRKVQFESRHSSFKVADLSVRHFPS